MRIGFPPRTATGRRVLAALAAVLVLGAIVTTVFN